MNRQEALKKRTSQRERNAALTVQAPSPEKVPQKPKKATTPKSQAEAEAEAYNALRASVRARMKAARDSRELTLAMPTMKPSMKRTGIGEVFAAIAAEVAESLADDGKISLSEAISIANVAFSAVLQYLLG